MVVTPLMVTSKWPAAFNDSEIDIRARSCRRRGSCRRRSCRAAADGVGAAVADERVVAGAAVHGVVARAAVQEVVAVAAVEDGVGRQEIVAALPLSVTRVTLSIPPAP